MCVLAGIMSSENNNGESIVNRHKKSQQLNAVGFLRLVINFQIDNSLISNHVHKRPNTLPVT